MTYVQLENDIYQRFTQRKTKILKPIVAILAFCKIHPNMVTATGIIAMVIFVFVVKDNLLLGAALIFYAIFISDALDGSLARYLNIQNDQGKFIDILAGNINYTLFIVGLVYSSLLPGLIGTILVYVMILCKILMIIKKNISKKTDWLIHAQVGAYPNVFGGVLYFLFFYFAFGGPNYFVPVAIIAIFFLIAKIFLDFLEVKRIDFHRLEH